ncbi:membrane protein [Burkholderia lata]|uniref:Membrane protein n=1 Tax=Burkholderia lata (strain ATCC 17760 / DSM 23089 / LMG 22485 / NCIMB 9086 / R18194 / 383) TaxID=482957 RepID=A0A6P2N181_BURL3|nr:methyl-accepting chemotaxis protein [Burkholderia lata]VWB87981.1 membrane protein [Burkholderia lata]
MSKLTGTIKFKIALAFGACFLVMVAIGLTGVRGLAKLSTDMDSMYALGTIPVEDLATTHTASLQMRVALDRLAAQTNPADAKQIVDRMHEFDKKLTAAWNDYYPAKVTADDERKVADQIASQLAAFRSLSDATLAAAAGGNAEAVGATLDKLRPVGVALSDGIDADIAINVAQVKDAATQGSDTFHLLQWVSFGVLAVGVAVAIGAWFYLQRAITQPLEIAMTAARRIADGRLENRLETRSTDEFGRLLSALRQMDTQLAGIVRGIKTSSESILVASKQIAAGNMDLSSRTEEQAASLEQTAASMDELTATVKQNAENAIQATTLATNASQIADKGGEAVGQMLATMTEISTSSTKIAEITGLIESIAFQTNILALNAAVEAARAGEQGRGFAVVAGEVRSLAQRASSAAKEIKDLIQRSATTVREGSTQAEAVGRTMSEIQQAIRRVSDINAEIAAASDEQSRGIEQVNVAVGQMDEVTQQNAALVEEASAAAQSLEQQAAEQKRAISVFRLSGETGEPGEAGAIAAASAAVRKTQRPAPLRAVAGPALAAARTSAPADWETF